MPTLLEPTYRPMDLLHAMQSDRLAPATELANLGAILAQPLADRRPWMLYGIVGSVALFAVALLGALRQWPEALVYLLAAACLAALAWGAWRGSLPRRQRDRAVLAALAEQPLPILVRATVSTELPESARVLIVNFLNRTYPGWAVDFDSADADWRALKEARGGGCGSSCGSGCGR